MSEHLDQGFLPKKVIYDYDETYKDSNKVLQKALLDFETSGRQEGSEEGEEEVEEEEQGEEERNSYEYPFENRESLRQ